MDAYLSTDAPVSKNAVKHDVETPRVENVEIDIVKKELHQSKSLSVAS